MTDPYRDLRRTEGSSSPVGRPSFGEAKPLRLRRIGPERTLSAPGESPAASAGVFGFATVAEPARTTSRPQALLAALLSVLLLGSLTALALIGSGGLPSSPVAPLPTPLVRDVVGSPVEPVSGGGPAGQPEVEVPELVPPAVDETASPLPVGGGDQGGGGQGDEDQGGEGGGGGDQGGGGQGGGDQGGGDQGGDGQGEGETGGGGQDGGGEVPPGGEVQPPPSDGGDSVAKESEGGATNAKAKAKAEAKGKGKGHQKQKGKGHGGMTGEGPGKGKGMGHEKHGKEKASEPSSESVTEADEGEDPGSPPAGPPASPGKGKGESLDKDKDKDKDKGKDHEG